MKRRIEKTCLILVWRVESGGEMNCVVLLRAQYTTGSRECQENSLVAGVIRTAPWCLTLNLSSISRQSLGSARPKKVDGKKGRRNRNTRQFESGLSFRAIPVTAAVESLCTTTGIAKLRRLSLPTPLDESSRRPAISNSEGKKEFDSRQ